MGKYLKLFQNHTEYEEAKTSGLTLPNVSPCIQEAEVHYNPIKGLIKIIIEGTLGEYAPNPPSSPQEDFEIVKMTINGNEIEYSEEDELPLEYQNTYATVEYYIPEDIKTLIWWSIGQEPNDFKITIPEGIEYCESFFNSRLPSELILPSTFKGSNSSDILCRYNPNDGASHFVKLTVNATVPPLLGENSISYVTSSSAKYNYSNLVIYVPSQSVDAYKAASVWSNYANRIQAIQ